MTNLASGTLSQNIQRLEKVPYGGLLSSCCGGLKHMAATQRPFGPKGVFGGLTMAFGELDLNH